MPPSPAYLIPPVLCLAVSLFLAGITLVRKPQTRERSLFAVICLWWALLAPAFISHHMMDDQASILRLERNIHFLYVFLPALHIVFSHQLLQIKRRGLTTAAFVVSGLVALTTPTEHYLSGLIRYPWGYIARGGPAFQFFGVYAGLALLYVIILLVHRLRTEKNPVRLRKIAYFLISFSMAGVLTILNIPAMNGVDLYPAGNFIFIPLSMLAYGVLRYRLLDIRSMVLQTVFWLGVSSLVMVPNTLFIFWLYRFTDNFNLAVYSLMLVLWFLSNMIYLRHIQPAINRRFNRDRINLTRAGGEFLTNTAHLKNLLVLATEFNELIRRQLDIPQVEVFLYRRDPHKLEDPLTGNTLVLPEPLKAFLENRPNAIGAEMAETHPAYAEVAKNLLPLMQTHQASYLLPLQRSGRLVGVAMLSAPRHRGGLSPNELKFLDRMAAVGTAFSNSAMYQDISDITVILENRTAQLSHEIDERHRVETELRQSEEKHRLMAENLLDAIWTMDLDMQFSYVSPVVEKLLGWSPSEFMSLELDRILTPEALALAITTLSKELKLGEQAGNFRSSVTMELEHYHRSGDTIPMEISASFLLDEDLRPEGILGITRDIRERIRNQKERENLQEQLARSKKMEALGLLAGGVAHDLNNILSGIMSYPELLLADLPPDSALVRPLKTIQESGKRAAAVVNDLVTIARGVASTREISSLNEIIEEYLASSEHLELMRNHDRVTIEKRLAPDLLPISCSRIHIQKILMNLVANAVEALDGEETVTVGSENRHVDKPLQGCTIIDIGDYSVLRVSDTGPGIAEEDLERIFEPFYTKKMMGRSGTGLGLSVVWNTVQDHNGHIVVKSDAKGTSFEIFLPSTQEEINITPDGMPLAALRGNRETILIVDDEPSQREIATDILEFLGYHAIAMESGEDAVRYVRKNDVDLLLLDMVMSPGMSGCETYGAISRIKPGMPAVIASGFSETDDVRTTQALGAGPLIKKPYSIENLGQAIKSELATRSGR